MHRRLLRTMIMGFVALGLGAAWAPASEAKTKKRNGKAKTLQPRARSVAEDRKVVGSSLHDAATPKKKAKTKTKRRGKKTAAMPACGARLPDAALRPSHGKTKGLGAVANRSWIWPSGATLKVAFLDGDDAARRGVAKHAKQWSEHANINFTFDFGDYTGSGALPDILIQFDDPNCNSYFGPSSQYEIQSGRPSMHLCHLDQRDAETDPEFRGTVLHEFGHALGLEHEHQSPNARFDWDHQYVYDYYALIGWDHAMVDMWVFRQLDAFDVSASEYDKDSIMHYWFPPEFTKQRIVYANANILSAIDKREIAKLYPGRKSSNPARKKQRLLAVRNDTDATLDVKVVVQTNEGGEWQWSPAAEPAQGVSATIAAGGEFAFDGLKGRRAKLVATDAKGNTWNDYVEAPVALVDRRGYLDDEVQTYVVTIEGDPDTAGADSADGLYEAGIAALDSGRLKTARKRFRAFVEQYPRDERVPWAEFHIMRAWFDAGSYLKAADLGYDILVEHSDSDAAWFAWFYRGAAAFQLGDCDAAKAYFKPVARGKTGLGKRWQDAADEHLKLMRRDKSTYCG